MNPAVTLPGLSRAKPAIRIVGSLLLLILMLIVFPRQKLMDALRSIPASTFAAALPMYLAIHFVGCLKWHLLVNRAEADLPFLQSVRCYFGGMFSNLFFPSVIGGDVVTVALGVSRSSKAEGVVSGTIASRLLDLVSLLLLACLAVFVFPHRLNAVAERLIEVILAMFLGAGALACVAVFLLRRKARGRIAAYWQAFAAEWRRPGFTAVVFGLSLFSQAGLIALTAWLGAGSGLVLPMRAWLFAWPLAKLSAFVPITLAGIGARELVLAVLLIPFGAAPTSAASVGLAWDAVLIGGSLVAGAISKIAGLLAPATSSSSPPYIPQ